MEAIVLFDHLYKRENRLRKVEKDKVHNKNHENFIKVFIISRVHVC